MAQVRSNLTDAGYPQPTAGQLRLATRLMRACGALITDIPRHLSEALRPPPGFQALEPADAGAPEADAVHLSGDEETDVPPGVERRPLPPTGESDDDDDDDEVPRPLSDAGAPEADAAVHLSGNGETDVPPPPRSRTSSPPPYRRVR